MRRWLIALLLVLGGTAPALGGDLDGRWRVFYLDAALGGVDGWAQFDEAAGTVLVRYADPRSGEIVPADGSFTRAGNRLVITLRGRAPTPDESYPPPGQPVAIGGPGTITLRLGDAELALPLVAGTRPAAEQTRIELTLADDGRSAGGKWRQTVDAASARDGKGQGRYGQIKLLYDGSGGAEMSGAETWFRPQLAFVQAFALQDQMAFPFGEATWPEPFGADGKLKKPLADRRLIFVLGRGLPGTAAGSVNIESDDPNVSYSVYALASDTRKPSFALAPWIEDGWRKLEEYVGPEHLRQLRGYDVMILTATLRPGAQPGPRTFRIEGQEAAWQLQFGDWRGRLSIGRPLGFGQTEDAEFVYPQEQVQFEIFLDREIPHPTLTVIPGVVRADGKTVLGTVSRTVTLNRDADEPRRYLSDPVVVSDPVYADTYPSGTPILQAVPGDRVVVQFGDDPFLALRPPMDAALVVSSPRHVAAALTDDKNSRGRQWLDVLRVAATCHGLETPDLTGYDALKAETFEKRIVFAWTKLSKDIAVGEHAAAILLRDVFIDLLQGQARQYERALSDEEVLGYRRIVQDSISGELRPLGDVRVAAPGGTASFAASFSDEWMKQRHGLQGEALLKWRIAATREARQLYAVAVRRSLEVAREIKDCEVEKLLGLTGFDFGAVRHVAKQTLVTFDEQTVGTGPLTRPHWTADRRARAWVDRVAYVAGAVEDIRQVNKQDNEYLIIAVTIVATLPLAIVVALLALTAMFLLDLGSAVVSAGGAVVHVVEQRAEVRFAAGAAAIIGTVRYDAARARDYEWVTDYFSTLAAAGGAAMSGVQLYEGVLTAAQKAAIKRGRAVAETVTFETLGRLNRENLESLLAAIKRAGNLSARIGRAALDPVERKLVALKEAIDRALHPPPAWASQVAPDVWERVRHMARAPHVDRLFREAPQHMSELARTPEGLDLLWNPHANVAAYARAVQRVQNKRPPLGPTFFGQMTPGYNPPGLVIHDVGGASGPSRGVSVRVRDPNAPAPPINVQTGLAMGVDHREIADFSRGLEPDTLFATNGSILELSYAKIQPFADNAFRMVRGLPESLTPNGTPLGLYLNMRALHGLGVGYGDTGVTIVKLSQVVNANTCIQLQAMRRAFPNVPLEELAQHTFSYRYTKDFLEQAGFRVTGVIKVEASTAATPRSYANFFAGIAPVPTRATEAEIDAILETEVVAFANAHGVSPDQTIDFGYNIYLRVEPR
ncbi:MAG: hypothetical protein ABI439_06940 [Rhodospirillales bacterium]